MQKLLADDILRCPACASDPARREQEADPGRLILVKDAWLVCQSPGCGRKYPVRNDLAIMLVSEGDATRDVPVEELETP
ncbi:MAG: hypothetical protein GX605_05510 [Chloroflexi bacterium]|nr:hypothetical protein [Chloroflexota bacterium]